jgi:hypothetical protein
VENQILLENMEKELHEEKQKNTFLLEHINKMNVFLKLADKNVPSLQDHIKEDSFDPNFDEKALLTLICSIDSGGILDSQNNYISALMEEISLLTSKL